MDNLTEIKITSYYCYKDNTNNNNNQSLFVSSLAL